MTTPAPTVEFGGMNEPRWPTFTYEEPQHVEAFQWQPDDEAAAKEMLWWLVRRKAEFSMAYSSTGSDLKLATPIIALKASSSDYAHYVVPGDWVVRDGPGAFNVWEDPSFQVHYHSEAGEGK